MALSRETAGRIATAKGPESICSCRQQGNSGQRDGESCFCRLNSGQVACPDLEAVKADSPLTNPESLIVGTSVPLLAESSCKDLNIFELKTAACRIQSNSGLAQLYEIVKSSCPPHCT